MEMPLLMTPESCAAS